MRRKYYTFISAIAIISVLLLGSYIMGRNALRPGRNGITQQSKNLTGDILRNTVPYAGTPTNLPNAANIRLNPGAAPYGAGQQIQQQMGFDSQRADKIRDQLVNIKGIRQINAVVKGNTALIGYTPTDKTTNANAARNLITDRIKQMDATITNVIVHDSVDFSERLTKLVNNIKIKKPVSDLNNEFNQIMSSIKKANQ